MDQNIRTSYGVIVKSGNYSCVRKPKIVEAYGKEYQIPVKTTEFSQQWESVIKSIAKTTEISDTVKELKNGIALFIGEDEAERIFPADSFDKTNIKEIIDFWTLLNYELAVSQQKMLDEYTVSEVIRR